MRCLESEIQLLWFSVIYKVTVVPVNREGERCETYTGVADTSEPGPETAGLMGPTHTHPLLLCKTWVSESTPTHSQGPS